MLKAARQEGAGQRPCVGHRGGQAEEESPAERQDPVRQGAFLTRLCQYQSGIAQPTASHANGCHNFEQRSEFCKRRRLGDGGNGLEDCLFCIITILVTTGRSLQAGKHLAAF